MNLGSIGEFVRARSWLGKAVAVLVALALLLDWLYAPLATPVKLAALMAGFVLAVRYIRRGLAVVMWRLRHRLLITYLFIGVIPVLLLFTMAALTAELFYGQVATYLVNSDIERMKQAVHLAALSTSYDLERAQAGREAQPAALLSALRFHLPPSLADLDIQVEVAASPRWMRKESHGLFWTGDGYVLRAAEALRHGALLVTVPVDARLLERLAQGVGELRFLTRRSVPGNAAPVYEAESRFHGGLLPPPANRVDFQVYWVLSPSIVDWETGEPHATADLAVYSRPSLLNAKLFSTYGEFGRVPLEILGVVAAVFLGIELLSLYIGVRLTRTMTRAVADLYEGTERVNAGDLAWRIPVRSRDQLASLAESFNTMTASIRQLIEEQKEKQRLQLELDVARDVQANLFPKQVPSLNRLELTGLCSPARSVSGDYYDFVPLDERALSLVIGDVAGKGISAALTMAGIQSMLHTQLDMTRGALAAVAPSPTSQVPSRPDLGPGTWDLEPGTWDCLPAAYADTATLVGRLNRQLYQHIAQGHFATFFCALYDDETGALSYTNAGHPPPIILRGGAVERLEKGGVVLGVFPGAHYDQDAVALHPGDLFLAFTDGITEPENSYGEEFGEQRLLDLLRRNADRPVAEIAGAIMAAVQEWTDSAEQADDMTLVLARRR
jgi:sigma-B regulation protein RsbU (phosphoserine phosphatase)